MKKHTFILFILLCIGIAVFIITRPAKPVEERFSDSLTDFISEYDNYEELFEQYVINNSTEYEKVCSELYSVNEDISSIDEDLSILYWYFEKDEDITFSEAYDSFSHLDSVMSKYR